MCKFFGQTSLKAVMDSPRLVPCCFKLRSNFVMHLYLLMSN
uniref:Uncharacterized protein n=1 Tax=Anguilla anguilla TaxID=7936 RepID=A0A0E9WJP2_ANGAN